MDNGTWPKMLFALDVSRGLAALSVVLWHWQHFAYDSAGLSESFRLEQQPLYAPLRMFYEEGEKGVAYFFILSGFIFFWLYKDAIKSGRVTVSRFWIQRFSRLYPLHLATLLLVGILQIIYVAKNGSPWIYPLNDAYHFLLNLFSMQAWGLSRDWSFNGPTWSVSVEIFLYFVFFLVARVRLGNAAFCLVVSCLAMVGSVASQGAFITSATPILQGLSAFFLGGVVFYFTAHITHRLPSLKPVVHAATVLAWVLLIVNFYVFDFGILFGSSDILAKAFPIYILFPATICSLTLAEIDSGPGVKKWLSQISWIGDITYSSYLLHFPMQLICALAVSYGLLQPDFYLSSTALIAFFVVLVPLSHWTFVGFERPVQQWIRYKLKR